MVVAMEIVAIMRKYQIRMKLTRDFFDDTFDFVLPASQLGIGEFKDRQAIEFHDVSASLGFLFTRIMVYPQGIVDAAFAGRTHNAMRFMPLHLVAQQRSSAT